MRCVKTDKGRKLRPSEIPMISANTSKIRKDVGWIAEIPIERTIEDTPELLEGTGLVEEVNAD